MRARATELGEAPDLLAHYQPDAGFFFEHAGEGVVGFGAAVTITVPGGPDQVGRAARESARALGRLDASGDVPPVVVGALPFDGSSPATLVVPRVALVLRGGRAWRIVTGEDATTPEPEDPPERARAALRITSIPEPSAYVDAVALARKRIAAGELQKVVLARMLMARADHAFDRRALVARLRRAEPDAYTFAAHGFIGASPELLVARAGDAMRANPLAGTIARGGSDEDAARALLASSKDLDEHRIVVDAVRRALAGTCDPLVIDEAPSVLRTSKLMHLSTNVRGTLRAPAPDALTLAARLHPTPAVCGTPTADAMRAIAELERIDRTLYAGIVGWTDARGDGEWAVALRCAEVQGRIALLFAGAGIVADSDPEAELAETEAKFRGMLDALGYA